MRSAKGEVWLRRLGKIAMKTKTDEQIFLTQDGVVDLKLSFGHQYRVMPEGWEWYKGKATFSKVLQGVPKSEWVYYYEIPSRGKGKFGKIWAHGNGLLAVEIRSRQYRSIARRLGDILTPKQLGNEKAKYGIPSYVLAFSE